MKRITATAAFAIAALSLSGCTGGTSGPEAAAPSAASAPAASGATSAPPSIAPSGLKLSGATPELQTWIEKKHDEWVKNYAEDQPSAHDSVYIDMDVDAAIRTAEEDDIEKAWVKNLEWKSPRCGEIVITVKGNDWNKENLNSVGGLILVGLADKSPEVQVVTTVTEDGKTKDVDTRTDDDYLTEGGNVGGTCDA
ncbi:hypothetical protein [Arthrobacter rhombi]|uniref:hypothetical protein n=1 Tax=Arthrobacter rhombi TaxID=71253 RepID=UPI003FD2BDDF